MDDTRARPARSVERTPRAGSWRERHLFTLPLSVLLGLSCVAGLAALVAEWLG